MNHDLVCYATNYAFLKTVLGQKAQADILAAG